MKLQNASNQKPFLVQKFRKMFLLKTGHAHVRCSMNVFGWSKQAQRKKNVIFCERKNKNAKIANFGAIGTFSFQSLCHFRSKPLKPDENNKVSLYAASIKKSEKKQLGLQLRPKL